MPDLLSNKLNQTATYWASSGVDSAGDDTWASPTSISVRWEEKKVLFTNTNGEDQMSNAVIFLDQDVTIGDYLFLGTSAASDPTNVVEARKVEDFSKVPSIDGQDFVRKAIV